jgi:hypothetical protein
MSLIHGEPEMSDLPLTLEQAYKGLHDWTMTLLRNVESSRSRVIAALDPDTQLPEGCHTHASAAFMEFRGVQKALDEVSGFINQVENAIRAK